MKNAIVIHLYYIDLWPEFSEKLKALPQDFDLYITLSASNKDITQDIHNDFPNANVFVLANKGLDVGPFLYVLDYIFKKDITYNIVYKIHSKKSKLHGLYSHDGVEYGDAWRNGLINCLLGSSERYQAINNTMASNQYVGMCGSVDHLTTEKNTIWLMDLMFELNVKGVEKVFVAGTMFAVRFSLLKEFFGTVDLVEMYNRMPYGYVANDAIMHQFERIFGFIVTDSGHAILGLKKLA